MSIAHWVVVVAVVVVLFGRGRISALMADVGKGLREGKKALLELDTSEIKSAAKDLRSFHKKLKEPLS